MILRGAGALLEKRTDNSWFFNASGGLALSYSSAADN